MAPKVDDPGAAAALGMIDWILQTVATRCGNEVQWMREEIVIITALAERLLESDIDEAGAIAAALARLKAGITDAEDVATVQGEYDLASEVLSCDADAAVPRGGAARDDVEQVLNQRLDREMHIRGEFTLPGRG